MAVEFTSAAFTRLLETVLARATHRNSLLHGEAHWRAVTWTALELATRVPGADPLVGFLFGLLHDSQRLDDGYDREHGPRAAEFTRRLSAEGALPALSGDRIEQLVHAVHHHTTGRRSSDPTVGLCWDADRLNLWRIGIEPRAEFLSTAAAREPRTIEMHRSLPGQRVEWMALHARLRA